MYLSFFWLHYWKIVFVSLSPNILRIYYKDFSIFIISAGNTHVSIQRIVSWALLLNLFVFWIPNEHYLKLLRWNSEVFLSSHTTQPVNIATMTTRLLKPRHILNFIFYSLSFHHFQEYQTRACHVSCDKYFWIAEEWSKCSPLTSLQDNKDNCGAGLQSRTVR